MNCISLPTYDYLYISKKDEVKTKSLNIFQCFLRKAFGAYEKTHLGTFANKAYLLSFDADFTCPEEKRASFLSTLKKAEARYQVHAELQKRYLPSGTEVSVQGKFNMPLADTATTIYDIKIEFLFKSKTTEKKHAITISKNKETKNLYVSLPNDLFWGLRTNNSLLHIQNIPTTEEVIVINDFINDLLYNSKEERFVWFGRQWTNYQKENAYGADVLSAQKNTMTRLHWTLGPELNEYRQFYYEKSAAFKVKEKIGPDHSVSINFAASLIPLPYSGKAT